MSRRIRHSPSALFAIAALCGSCVLFVAGCGGDGRPPLGKVHGQVTLDGKPLPSATVIFAPEAGGRQSNAVTNENGEYILTYIREDQGGAVGKNTVRITKLRSHAASSDVVPVKYNRNTTLTADVKSGDNEINFSLTSK